MTSGKGCSRTLLQISPLLLLITYSLFQDRSVFKTFTSNLKEEAFIIARNDTAKNTTLTFEFYSRSNDTTSTASATLRDAPKIIIPSLPALNESMSACLLIMDENFRLHEWISYHYHVLPLRYLVVAVDPRSKHSPEPIFDEFRQHLNMEIISWNDTDFLAFAPLKANAKPKQMRKRHLARQRQFLQRCLSHLYQHNRTWTALWDTDEYIAYNRFESPRKTRAANRTSVATAPKDMSEPGTILRYLKDFEEEKCVTMPRVLVGNKETPGLLNESHPFDPRRFDTLRFRFRGRIGDKAHGFGKSLLNVQHIPSFPVLIHNPHRPVMEICPAVMGISVNNSPFYLNHFIGSWEAYSYRDDSRRGMEKNYNAYMERAQQNKVYENKMAQWMPAFLDSVGEERGTILLKDAGLDPEYNASFKIISFQWRCVGSTCK